ncbi:hypothetical protein ACO0LF_24985 [Undibacterium sp. Di27W]|uniref:hypothetical protein n=1 Tax=Undibacterium sp. Di27W TaxID=3413036 RepID=UPI003BF2B9B4
MQDISNLKSVFSGDVQALQGKLKSSLAEVEENAAKFKLALQNAVQPETKAELVSAIKEKATTALHDNGFAADLVSQIQASLAALGQQLQAPQLAPAPVPATATALVATVATVATVASVDSAAVAAAGSVATTAASVTDTASSKAAVAPVASVPAAAPAVASQPAAVPTSTIAAVNTTHPAYRVYDPSNPAAFAEPNNPGGGPNLLAANLVFNPDPRPDSVHSLKRPTAEIGSAEWGTQLKNYEVAYEKLSKDNNDWNQKNITIRNQTLLASPYAAFAGTQGVNQAALSDPYYLAYKADPSKAPG